VVTLLNEGKRKFPEENKIELLLGLLYHFRIKNSLQAVYAIAKMASGSRADVVDRFF
jgi:two-component sensor histidine kinase